MKIIHIGCPYYPYLGGSTARLSSIVNACSKNNEISLYLITPSESKDKLKDNKPFVDVLRTKNVNRLGYHNEIYDFINKVNPDVVVLHNSRVLLNWCFFYSRFFKSKSVCEIHSFRDNSKLQKLLNRYLYKKCNKVVVLSNGAKSYLSETYNVNDAEVIINGLEITSNKDEICNKNNYDCERLTFSYIGSFYNWQGVEDLAIVVKNLGLEYWKRNVINLIGDGPSLSIVKDLIGKDLIENGNVKIYGWMNKQEIIKILNQTDYLLAPRPSTIATETVVPLKVLESIQYRKPMICSNVEGLKELLSEDKNLAIFYDKNNLQSLLHTFKNLPNENEYKIICENLETMSNHLPTWRDASDKYIELFRSI